MDYSPNYRLPIPQSDEDADAPEWGGLLAEAIEQALAGFVAQREDGTKPLFFAPGQSSNPVTVWGRELQANGSHTGGSNIQFEWTDASIADKATLRVHVDARAGVPGQGGFVGYGKAYFDLAWLPNLQVNIGAFGTYRDTRYAVVNGSLDGAEHRMIMAWNHVARNRILVAQEAEHLGQIAIEMASSAALKEDVRAAARNAAAFGEVLELVEPVQFRFTDAPEAGVYRGTEHVGFLAGEVADAFAAAGLPDGAVVFDAEGQAVGLNDRDLLAVLWQVVREQRTVIADLTARVEGLEAKV